MSGILRNHPNWGGVGPINIKTAEEAAELFGAGSPVHSCVVDALKTPEQRAKEAQESKEYHELQNKLNVEYRRGMEIGLSLAKDIIFDKMRDSDDRQELMLLAELLADLGKDVDDGE